MNNLSPSPDNRTLTFPVENTTNYQKHTFLQTSYRFNVTTVTPAVSSHLLVSIVVAINCRWSYVGSKSH